MHAPTAVAGESRESTEVGGDTAGFAARNAVHWAFVFMGALLLFSPALFAFSARVIDLSALRVMRGAVPYRDFWTMYAPGSIYANALAFRIFGEQLIVSNALGVLTSAAAVAVYYRLAGRLLAPLAAMLAAVIFAIAFFHAPYHGGLTSYPAAILFIWLAVDRIAQHARSGLRRDLLLAGFCLGAAVFFKHDVGGYASIAMAATLLLTPGRDKLRNVVTLALSAFAVVLGPLAALIAAGAGPDMLRDLVIWPLGDFRIVRPEYFPLLPPLWEGSIKATVMRNAQWSILQVPVIAILAAIPLLWRSRHRITVEQRRILVFVLAMFPLIWTAAHVQVNTHAVTLPALGVLFGFAGLFGMRDIAPVPSLRWRLVLLAVVTCWGLSMLPERVARYYADWFPNPQSLNLPRLAGIRVSAENARDMRALAQAIEQGAPPEAPVLMLAARNDIVIHAEGAPYWLSRRRMVTRHHELHPGITDTEEYQRQMLADIESGPPPVIVREHRFGRRGLDRWKQTFQQQGLAVGGMLLDNWLDREYLPGEQFGMYEVMMKR